MRTRGIASVALETTVDGETRKFQAVTPPSLGIADGLACHFQSVACSVFIMDTLVLLLIFFSLSIIPETGGESPATVLC